MALQVKLSDGIHGVLTLFEPYTEDKDGIELSQEAVVSIVYRLRVLEKLSHAIEQEVQVHRLIQAAKATRTSLEQLSTEALTHMVLDPEGKVIKPDFGRKP